MSNRGILSLFVSALALTQAFGCLYFIFQAVARIIEFRHLDQVASIFFAISGVFLGFYLALSRVAKHFNQGP